VGEHRREERVGEPVDRPSVGVALARASPGTRWVDAEGPPERGEADGDAEPPADRTGRVDGPGDAAGGRERETDRTRRRQRRVDRRRPERRQRAV
jgi:hypothetical protein